MYRAVQQTLDDHEDTWTSLPAFGKKVEAFNTAVEGIDELAQTQASKSGSASDKASALTALGDAAFAIAGAVRTFAMDNDNHELAGRVDFSRTDVSRGRDNAIVARCRDIHAAATENLASLADYGVTADKLTKLKKKIDAFNSLQPVPRKKISKRSAATKALPGYYSDADDALVEGLDKLVVQFKETAPEFVNEYESSRVIVDSGGRSAIEPKKNSPTPGTDLPKAA